MNQGQSPNTLRLKAGSLAKQKSVFVSRFGIQDTSLFAIPRAGGKGSCLGYTPIILFRK